MKKLIKIIPLVLIVFLAYCETTELDLATKPNELTEDNANVDFLYNSIQVESGRWIQSFGNRGGDMTRVSYMFGRTYLSNYEPPSSDFVWRQAYQRIFTDIVIMKGLAEENEQFAHIGMAQVLQAFILATLVDFYGDVPWTQALDPVEFPNPVADSGSSVYDAALGLLDEGISNLNAGSTLPEFDLFYSGDLAAWVRAANTIKLRLYLNRRLVDGSAMGNFNQIINSGNYIQNTSQDFQFRWGTQNVNPGESRHPLYSTDYSSTGAGNYQSNWLMDHMIVNNDPRIRYYFFRQVGCTPGNIDINVVMCLTNQQTLICSDITPPPHYQGFPYCSLPFGYWGRDHGNDEGIPPDGFTRTTAGVYPAAGRFDADYFINDPANARVGPDLGGQGVGITPVILASTVDFMIAESRIINNDFAGALSAITDGISKSCNKVQDFGSRDTTVSSDDWDTYGTDATDTAVYIADIQSKYNSANNSGKFDILGNQLFVNLYGNGIDAYNFYRRTGYPTTLQPCIELNSGAFTRSFFYPANEANTNSSISQKPDQKVQVFWDTNPGFPSFPFSN